MNLISLFDFTFLPLSRARSSFLFPLISLDFNSLFVRCFFPTSCFLLHLLLARMPFLCLTLTFIRLAKVYAELFSALFPIYLTSIRQLLRNTKNPNDVSVLCQFKIIKIVRAVFSQAQFCVRIEARQKVF